MCGLDQVKKRGYEAAFDESQLTEYSFSSRKLPEFMHFEMKICSECDLLYTSKVPQEDWIQSQYNEAAFDSEDVSKYAAKNHAQKLSRIVSSLPNKKLALDIGAGDGTFLLQLQRVGFEEVIGIEPSSVAIEAADPSIKPRLRQAFFSGNECANNTVSLMTCFQTVEHVPDPSLLFSKVYKMLEPGGIFYLVAHNYRALSAKLLGTRSPIFDLEHLQIHSKFSLNKLFKQTGFEKIDVGIFKNSFPLSYWLRLLPIISAGKKKRIIDLLKNKRFDFQIPLFAGNIFGIGCKPKT